MESKIGTVWYYELNDYDSQLRIICIEPDTDESNLDNQLNDGDVSSSKPCVVL